MDIGAVIENPGGRCKGCRTITVLVSMTRKQFTFLSLEFRHTTFLSSNYQDCRSQIWPVASLLRRPGMTVELPLPSVYLVWIDRVIRLSTP